MTEVCGEQNELLRGAVCVCVCVCVSLHCQFVVLCDQSVGE